MDRWMNERRAMIYCWLSLLASYGTDPQSRCTGGKAADWAYHIGDLMDVVITPIDNARIFHYNYEGTINKCGLNIVK